MPSNKTRRNPRFAKKFRKHKLLFDESLPPTTSYPKLNQIHNVKHISHDLKRGGSKDAVVYQIAKKENRMIVVFNTKDFKPLLDKGSPSIIALSTNISNKQADLKICRTLSQLSPKQLRGCLISITRSGVDIRIPN